jgi:pyridoxal phosphate enzyme (YggS family)
MIGHLQTNKVRDAVYLFDFVHSVDSLALAQELNRRALGQMPVLLEVNICEEVRKYGFTVTEVQKDLEAILQMPNLKVVGLMTMAPQTDDMSLCRLCFKNLVQLAGQLQTQYRISLPHLSMGMSQDFEVAIEEGSTMVRIGTALFAGVEM